MNIDRIYIYEMFMRDGLQSLNKIYTLDDKIFFLNELLKVGFRNIEFGSTTESTLLPQMADSYQLWNYIKENYNIYGNYKFTMLITNDYHLKKYLFKSELKLDITHSFGLLCSLSPSFSYKNLKKDSIESFQIMMKQANDIIEYSMKKKKKYHIRLYLSCFFGSFDDFFDNSYKKNINECIKKIVFLIQLYNLSFQELDIVICDTYGILTENINRFIEIFDYLSEILRDNKLYDYISLHSHTDSNHFQEIVDIALSYGIRKFDSSMLGIGGCPFSGKKYVSNMNTKKLILYLEKKGYKCGVHTKLLDEIQKRMFEKL
jgi:hydroxymethylglutaryl-CoA lyase